VQPIAFLKKYLEFDLIFKMMCIKYNKQGIGKEAERVNFRYDEWTIKKVLCVKVGEE